MMVTIGSYMWIALYWIVANAIFSSIEGSFSRNFAQRSKLMGGAWHHHLLVNVRKFHIRSINLQFTTPNFTSLKLGFINFKFNSTNFKFNFISFKSKLKWIYKISLLWYLVGDSNQLECEVWHVVSVIQLQNDSTAVDYLDQIKNFMSSVSLKSSFKNIFY